MNVIYGVRSKRDMDDEFDLNDFASEDIDDQFGIDSDNDLVDDESDPISADLFFEAIHELFPSAQVGGASNSEKQMTSERVQKQGRLSSLHSTNVPEWLSNLCSPSMPECLTTFNILHESARMAKNGSVLYRSQACQNG